MKQNQRLLNHIVGGGRMPYSVQRSHTSAVVFLAKPQEETIKINASYAKEGMGIGICCQWGGFFLGMKGGVAVVMFHAFSMNGLSLMPVINRPSSGRTAL